MREKLLIWLGQEKFTIESLKDPGFISLFRAYQPTSPKNKISVSQAAGEDKIVIASGIFLDDEDQSLMTKFPAEKRTQIIKELSKVLYSNASTFRMEEDQGVLKGITMTRFIFADGLSKDRFMNAISDLYGTQALVLLHLSDYAGTRDRASSRSSQEHKAVPAAAPANEKIAKGSPPPARVITAPPVPPPPPVYSAPPVPPMPPPSPPAVTRVFCVHCGKEIQSIEKFCRYCGTKRFV